MSWKPDKAAKQNLVSNKRKQTRKTQVLYPLAPRGIYLVSPNHWRSGFGGGSSHTAPPLGLSLSDAFFPRCAQVVTAEPKSHAEVVLPKDRVPKALVIWGQLQQPQVLCPLAP